MSDQDKEKRVINKDESKDEAVQININAASGLDGSKKTVDFIDSFLKKNDYDDEVKSTFKSYALSIQFREEALNAVYALFTDDKTYSAIEAVSVLRSAFEFQRFDPKLIGQLMYERWKSSTAKDEKTEIDTGLK